MNEMEKELYSQIEGMTPDERLTLSTEELADFDRWAEEMYLADTTSDVQDATVIDPEATTNVAAEATAASKNDALRAAYNEYQSGYKTSDDVPYMLPRTGFKEYLQSRMGDNDFTYIGYDDEGLKVVKKLTPDDLTSKVYDMAGDVLTIPGRAIGATLDEAFSLGDVSGPRSMANVNAGDPLFVEQETTKTDADGNVYVENELVQDNERNIVSEIAQDVLRDPATPLLMIANPWMSAGDAALMGSKAGLGMAAKAAALPTALRVPAEAALKHAPRALAEGVAYEGASNVLETEADSDYGQGSAAGNIAAGALGAGVLGLLGEAGAKALRNSATKANMKKAGVALAKRRDPKYIEKFGQSLDNKFSDDDLTNIVGQAAKERTKAFSQPYTGEQEGVAVKLSNPNQFTDMGRNHPTAVRGFDIGNEVLQDNVYWPEGHPRHKKIENINQLAGLRPATFKDYILSNAEYAEPKMNFVNSNDETKYNQLLGRSIDYLDRKANASIHDYIPQKDVAPMSNPVKNSDLLNYRSKLDEKINWNPTLGKVTPIEQQALKEIRNTITGKVYDDAPLYTINFDKVLADALSVKNNKLARGKEPVGGWSTDVRGDIAEGFVEGNYGSGFGALQDMLSDDGTKRRFLADLLTPQAPYSYAKKHPEDFIGMQRANKIKNDFLKTSKVIDMDYPQSSSNPRFTNYYAPEISDEFYDAITPRNTNEYTSFDSVSPMLLTLLKAGAVQQQQQEARNIYNSMGSE